MGRVITHFIVIPAKAGIHPFNNFAYEVDPGFRRGDDERLMRLDHV